LRSLSTSVPGAGAGDNLTFVWNLWWARHALQSGMPLLWSPAIFAPFGVSLALHTHTVLPDVVAALLMGNASVVAGTNVIVATHIFLNFAVAYALAFRVTRSQTAAVLAALVFGWSPYIGAHLAGHFNLIAAWLLPLSALLTSRALDRKNWVASLLPGLAVGVTVYVDYYYAVYSLLTIAVMVLMRNTSLSTRPRVMQPWQRRVVVALVALIVVDLAAIAWIRITGGAVLTVAGTAVSVRSAANPAAAAALIAIVALSVAVLPQIVLRIDWAALYGDAGRLVPGGAVAAIGALPVLLGVYHLWTAGDYVSQQYFWRSAPPGIDIATALLGNPGSLLWGGLPTRIYSHLGVDTVEQIAWIGPGVLALSAAAIVLRGQDSSVRAWSAIAVVFFLWALGPYLVAFGHNLRLPLPATLLRYMPIISNARIPGRAVVMVYLSVAMLGAMGFAALRASGRRGWAMALAVLAIADYLPAAPPAFRVDRPAVYDVLRQQATTGALCELPLGLRDGFREIGKFDSRILWYQTIHERPIAGGFIARLPLRIIREYDAMPVLGSLLRLSSGGSIARETRMSADEARRVLERTGFRFIILNHRLSPRVLEQYVAMLPLRPIAEDNERTLYVLQ